MPTIAYLSNLYPSLVEPYVSDEIRELQRRGIHVIPCSVRRPKAASANEDSPWGVLCLQPLRLLLMLHAAWLCLRRFGLLRDLVRRVIFQGNERPSRRFHALLHTWLGACLALLLENRGVQHIHVHHGYFGSWVAMVASRLMDIPFSMTLHGSDLLVHAAYIGAKLEHCQFCVTVSEFNRRHILEHYPGTDPGKISVCRMGVDCRNRTPSVRQRKPDLASLRILAVGRLHAVKDHAFLVRGCHALKYRGLRFDCLIAGEGPERSCLERLICKLDLQEEVRLLGQVAHDRLDDCYEMADLIVLTSRSEGIPLVLMEAMAHEKPVLAPAITGVPELVINGQTGFLYRPQSLDDFVLQVELIHHSRPGLGPLQLEARQHVLQNFNRETNLAVFCDLLISHLSITNISDPNFNQVA